MTCFLTSAEYNNMANKVKYKQKDILKKYIHSPINMVHANIHFVHFIHV